MFLNPNAGLQPKKTGKFPPNRWNSFATWKAEEGAQPAIGGVGKTEKIDEVKIEMECPKEIMQQVVEAIKRVHPYEKIVIDAVPVEQFT